MSRKLYFDCYMGLSCEKLLDALLGLGVDEGELKQQLERLTFQKVEINNSLTLKQVETMIEKSEIKACIKEQLLWILENTVQNSEISEESILELTAVLICIDMLGFSQFILSPVTEGIGTKEGKMIPDTTVMKLIEKYKIPVHFIPGEGEKITLFGAGTAACLMSKEKLPSAVYVEKTGLGTGIRAMILNTENEETVIGEKRDTVQVLETNVDDCSGEQLGYAIECLMKAGALDASCFPIYMKKQRPAYMLQVICKKEKQEQLEDVIFRETTSIGLRRYEEKRRILPRTFREVRLKDGHKVKIKICEHHGQNFYYPEYETVKQVCEKTGRPYRNVYDEAAALAGGFYDDL